MNWKNTIHTWGLVSVALHWLSAVVIVALFGLGLWMVELTYYDSWYTKAPFIHKSVGIIILLLTLFRIIWKYFNVKPQSIKGHSRMEQKLATMVHALLYALLFLIIFSGYLISTADGKAVSVFTWFEIPAIIYAIDKQEDIAGVIHLYLAISLMVLVVLHALGALKHHLMDKDITLKRMLNIDSSQGERK